ncbi:hypothetical protein CR513_04592, partial [Mucuna pruriens]
MGRCMSKVKSMPKEFWTVYWFNCSPTRNVKSQTPKEAWSGVKLKVYHLRVFESIAYDHVPN